MAADHSASQPLTPEQEHTDDQGPGCLDRGGLRPRTDRLSEGDVRGHTLGNGRRSGRAARAAAGRTAKAFDMPIVLSTVGVTFGLNGPTLPSILSELDGVEPIDRSSMNAFEDQAFRRAVEAAGRRRLIIGGLHTEICLTFASVQALKDGYDVMYVTDAVGGRSQTAHRTAIERLAHAGAVPTTALAVVTELFRDWATPLAGPAREVIDWYFNEVPKLTDAVGVAEAEKLAAADQKGQ
ncbi:isochorismatase family protein [Streptomyces pseudovenezuelae]|nr:isochorismatase family protein [Streptomyces pseudovenezuelae]